MELSQSALAMLIIGGLPLGLLLNVVYRITDPLYLKQSVIVVMYKNVKDFLFMIVSGLLIVVMIYYVNSGEYRYLSILGTAASFWLSDLFLGKMIVGIRNAILRKLLALLRLPFHWLWRNTLGIAYLKVEEYTIIKSTQKRELQLQEMAANGFENITEAKEWKKRKSNRILP